MQFIRDIRYYCKSFHDKKNLKNPVLKKPKVSDYKDYSAIKARVCPLA